MKPSELLCRRFSFSKTELLTYASTCPHRYKRYKVMKRNGKGYRQIAQPSRDLKAVQNVLLNEYLAKRLDLHECATAYKAGASILKNAEPHLKNQYILKMDFTDFFPSIKDSDFDYYLQKKAILEDETERFLLTRIFFMRSEASRVLSIGSPGSPVISNALLYDFDDFISKESRKNDVAYTRYSDDMMFSTKARDVLFQWPKLISEILKNIDSPRLRINQQKTVFSSKKFNRHVTGVTISNDGTASLGRSKKREIRTRVFLTRDGSSSAIELLRLKGYISFARSIEPQFVESLWKKYPKEMTKLFRATADESE